MSEVPQDIRDAVSKIFADALEGEYGYRIKEVQNYMLDDVSITDLMANAILAERERCAKVLDDRRAVYLKKMDRSSILAEDSLTRHEMFKHTVVALDILDAKCFGNEPPVRD